MGNFRVGDKVICINDDWGGKNLIYTLRKIPQSTRE